MSVSYGVIYTKEIDSISAESILELADEKMYCYTNFDLFLRSLRKAPETLTSKQRVLKTFNYEKTDRVPIDYSANQGIHARLAQALGIKNNDAEQVRKALGVDYRGIEVPYIGKSLFEEVPGYRTSEIDGFRMRWVEHASGGYWDICNFPLQDASPEMIANFPVPNPDDFDYDCVPEQISAYKDYALYIANCGIPDIINSNGRLMGMENILMDLMTEEEATLILVERRAPMVSLDLYRKTIKPIHKRFVDLAKSYGLRVMIHTCGCSSWAYEDFIEIGVDAVDTLQPEAHNMSPRYLKDYFGGRLSFHGCISTAGPLAYGTVQDVQTDVRETLKTMMDGYGYHFCTTHMMQDNTPVENVIAMYQAAHEYGVYAK